MSTILELTEACVLSAGKLYRLLGFEVKDECKEDQLIESFGLILANLYYSDSISLNESGQIIACLVASMYGNNTARFYQTAKCAEFYSRVFYHFRDKYESAILKNSILLHNLKHPKTWNDFDSSMPLCDLDFFDAVQGSAIIEPFLNKELPSIINPILEKL